VRHLRDDTVLILDGEVRVYRRERSKRWQAPHSDVRYTYIRLRISPLGLLHGRYKGLGPSCKSKDALALAGICSALHNKDISFAHVSFWNAASLLCARFISLYLRKKFVIVTVQDYIKERDQCSAKSII